MHYEPEHLFVLAPLPTEDAFLLSVEITAGGTWRIVRDGSSFQLGLQQEGSFHIADLSHRASAYICSPFHSMLFHLRAQRSIRSPKRWRSRVSTGCGATLVLWTR
jgi:hypothetical protein